MTALPRLLRVAMMTASLAMMAGCAQRTASLPPAPHLATPVAAMPAALPPYKVQIGDVLDIKLYLDPELSDEVVVLPDGMISTSICQDVPAYGHTPAQIAAELRERYDRVLTSPHITVIVHSFAPTRVYVAGQVKHPGEFVTVGPDLTVSQAIARAGGTTLGASRKEIFILRRGAGATATALAVNYPAVISGRDPSDDVRLAPFDVVYVPRSGIYETYTFWNQFVQQFLPANWGFSTVVR
jgi:polysaccharide export outer membrane protein